MRKLKEDDLFLGLGMGVLVHRRDVVGNKQLMI